MEPEPYLPDSSDHPPVRGGARRRLFLGSLKTFLPDFLSLTAAAFACADGGVCHPLSLDERLLLLPRTVLIPIPEDFPGRESNSFPVPGILGCDRVGD